MLLNIKEAALHCGFRSRSQIYKLIDGGRIDKFVRVTFLVIYGMYFKRYIFNNDKTSWNANSYT